MPTPSTRTTITARIQQSALQIIQQNGGSIRFTPLKLALNTQYPNVPDGTITNAIRLLTQNLQGQVVKSAPGLYVSAGSTIVPLSPTVNSLPESAFYQPLADYLRDDLDEATAAEPLGGSGLGQRWGTPDVVGTYKRQASDRIDFPTEIITGEVKIDPTASVVAFGQAMAYRLFSTRVYLAMPKTVPQAELRRLEALCLLFGVGLIVFDGTNATTPNFVSLTRAQRFSPDMFYVNEFASRLHQNNPSLFNRLF